MTLREDSAHVVPALRCVDVARDLCAALQQRPVELHAERWMAFDDRVGTAASEFTA